MTFQNELKFSESHYDFVKEKCSPLLITNSPFELDTTKAADLITMIKGEYHIGVRIRREQYKPQFGYQFTLRGRSFEEQAGHWLPHPHKSEYQKVKEGCMDYFFYGFGDGEKCSLWYPLDMEVFREHIQGKERKLIHKGVKETTVQNGQRRVEFVWYDVRTFPKRPALIVRASESVPGQSFQFPGYETPRSPVLPFEGELHELAL